jgi:GNAT superfamily N-acetyltransferase
MFVDPAWAGRGVGAALLSNAWERAAGPGGVVRLESTLNAAGFYEHFGFHVLGRSTVRRNDVDVPIIVMEKPAG